MVFAKVSIKCDKNNVVVLYLVTMLIVENTPFLLFIGVKKPCDTDKIIQDKTNRDIRGYVWVSIRVWTRKVCLGR